MGPATGSNGAAGSVIREEFERGGGGSYLSRSSRPSASEVGLNWREFGSARGRGVGVGRGRGRVAPCLYGPNWAAGDSAENGLMSPAAAACTEGRVHSAILVPPRKRRGARSDLNSCLRPLFRTHLLLLAPAPLHPDAGPFSGLNEPPESPSGLIWVYSVSYYGSASVVGLFLSNLKFLPVFHVFTSSFNFHVFTSYFYKIKISH